MKRVWAYLKEKKLQDPEDKRWFTPDETMAPVFGNKKIPGFGMLKYLKKHLTHPDGSSSSDFRVSPVLAKIIRTKKGEKISRSQVGLI